MAADRKSFRHRLHIAFLALVVGLAGVDVTTPSVSSLERATPERTSYMVHRARANGLADDAYRTDAISLADMPAVLVCAVVKAEDKSFFRHHGFDDSQIGRAAKKLANGEKSFGASTISQQLARNLFLAPEWSAWRKIREAIITARIEGVLGKRRILELYLDVIEWGDGVWGIGAASERYFKKAPRALDVFEATLLAGLVAAPLAKASPQAGGRIVTVQTRVLMQLKLAGIIDGASFAHARLRADEAQKELEAGHSVDDAIARAALEGAERSETDLEEALASECGLDREIAAMRAQE